MTFHVRLVSPPDQTKGLIGVFISVTTIPAAADKREDRAFSCCSTYSC
jgi:hypothetical protein